MIDITNLYRAKSAYVQRVVAGRVRTTPENVEDACQTAWTQLLRYQDQVAPESAVGWLIVTGARQAIKLHVRQHRTLPLLAGEDESIELLDPADAIAAREQLIDACAVLDQARLTDRQRRMVALQAAGHSYQAISERTGASMNTVQRQLLRAHPRMRQTRAGG